MSITEEQVIQFRKNVRGAYIIPSSQTRCQDTLILSLHQDKKEKLFTTFFNLTPMDQRTLITQINDTSFLKALSEKLSVDQDMNPITQTKKIALCEKIYEAALIYSKPIQKEITKPIAKILTPDNTQPIDMLLRDIEAQQRHSQDTKLSIAHESLKVKIETYQKRGYFDSFLDFFHPKNTSGHKKTATKLSAAKKLKKIIEEFKDAANRSSFQIQSKNRLTQCELSAVKEGTLHTTVFNHLPLLLQILISKQITEPVITPINHQVTNQ